MPVYRGHDEGVGLLLGLVLAQLKAEQTRAQGAVPTDFPRLRPKLVVGAVVGENLSVRSGTSRWGLLSSSEATSTSRGVR